MSLSASQTTPIGQGHYVLRLVASREIWNQFVSEHSRGHLLQSWGWGELKAHSGWRPLRLALWDRQKLRYVAVAQVLRRSAPHLPLLAGHHHKANVAGSLLLA